MNRRLFAAARVSALVLAAVGLPSLAEAQVLRDGVLAEAPVAPTHEWRFDEPSGGHAALDSIGGQTGTGGADALWISGEAQALGPAHDRVLVTFPQQGPDDRSAYVDFGNAVGAFGNRDFTVSHFFLTPHQSPGTVSDVVGNRTSYSHGNFFAVRMRGDGTLTVELDQDASGTNYVGFVADGVRVNDSKLHHLAYVRQGATLSLYVDGALVKSAQTASGQATFITGADSFRIGRRAPFSFTTPFAFYDDLRIYDRALNAQQIQTIASGG